MTSGADGVRAGGVRADVLEEPVVIVIG